MTDLTPETTAYRAALDVIRGVEPRVADAIAQELTDQREMLKLIASENYASPATLLTMGNWFSDKYAEGTVGRRFYAGCRNVDTVESLAAEHARAEGEDDRTLESWRRIHRQFFEDHIDVGREFSPEMPMVLERFRVVYPR